MKPPDRIRIRLLGGFELDRDDGIASPVRLSARKVCALVAFLAMSRKQAATREELATLLWGSCSDQQARQSLRQALVLLRKDLRSPHVLFADKETIRLEPGTWSVDALDFETLADSSKLEDLERAVELFGGEFLAGFTIEEEGFDEWLQAQRNRIQVAAGRVLATYAERSGAAGNGQQAIAAVERLLALDPLREDWQRLALRLHARHRGPHDALARAKTFEALLRRELDVDPEPETAALVERIRRGEVAPLASPASERDPPVSAVGITAETTSPPSGRSDTERAEYGQRSSVQDEARSPNRWWRPFGTWHARGTAAAITLAVLALVAGVLVLVPRGSVRIGIERASDKPAVETPVMADDSWRSPRLPSQRSDEPARPGRGLVSIAVLPFTSDGAGGAHSQTLADMMTDDLTNILSQVSGFRVISRQTSFSYRGQSVDPATVGAELGIRYLLKGGVQAQDGELRVSVELLDTKSRLHVWSGRFERTGADRTAIQSEIADSLGRELEIEVTRVESERGSKDPDVHELIYKGYAAMFGAATSGPPALQQAERYLTQALERDPENPRAQTGLAGYHVRMALRLFAADPIPHLATAEALLQQVIDRHPSSSEAHQFMGMVDITRGHADEAARSFERAIELNSSCAPCYAQLGRALLRMGRPAEGLEHIHYAMRLSPRDPLMPNWLAMAGGVELELEHYGKAIEYLDRARALDPGQPRFSLLLVAAHALAGNTIEARTRLEQLQKTLPHLTGEQLITRFFGKATGPELSRLSEGLRLALASPWESPRLPSRPVADPSTRPNSAMTAIAVLPFTTYGDTAGSIQLTADMLTDDLINSLSRAPLLRVISRQTTRSYQNKPIDIAAIGAELGVRYILEGTLRMQGDKLRVNVELIDPKTRLAVRAIRIERGSTELPAVQDEIIGRLARELSFDIFQVESDRAPKDPNVAELNFKGWAALLASGMSGMDGLKLGKGYFDEALARDPENGIARTGVGAYHAIVGALKLDADSEVHLREAEQILRQVVHEYPRNTTANFFLGVSFRAFGRFEDAIDCFERVLEISQSHAPAYAHLGEALVALGRAHEGIDHIRYALRLSPRDPSRSHWLRFAGQAELELNHHEQAVAYLRQSYALNSRQPGTLRSLAAALAVSGQTEDARRYAAEFRAVAPHLDEKGLQKRHPARETRQPELARGIGLAFVGSL